MARKTWLWYITGHPPHPGRGLAILALAACFVTGALVAAQGQAPRSPTPAPVKGTVRVETVARGLDHPWALAFLPDGRLLVTERPGQLRLVDRDGHLQSLTTGR